MNTQAIQKKLDEYMETATPEQVVKEFEDLGVKFEEDFKIKIDNNKKGDDSLFQQALSQANNMNLIQQLQATPKWEEFKDWYNKNVNGWVWAVPINIHGFANLPIEFQKGVFEKFITQGDLAYHSSYSFYKTFRYCIVLHPTVCHDFNSFEELLIWYFNN